MDESVLRERGARPGGDSGSAAVMLTRRVEMAVPAQGPAPVEVVAATVTPTPVTPAAVAPAPAAASHRARAVPSRWSALPYVIVLAGLAGGLAWLGLGGHVQGRHIEVGMVGVAVAVLVAALSRLVLPERNAGLLVCRHRLIDVMVLACIGAGLVATALVLPSPA